jgi:hypothetical protein
MLMSTYLLHRVARTGALVVLLYVAALGLTAAHADAATYHTYLCRIPYGPNAGKPAPTDNTVYTPYGANTVALQNCAAGGAMTAALTKEAQPQGAKAIVTFTAPGGLTVAGFRVWRHIGIHPSAVGAGEPISNLAYTGQQSAEPPCQASAGCTQRGDLATPLSPANEVALPNLSGVTEVAWGVGCRGAGGTCPAAGGTYSAVYNVLALDVLLNDATPPAVSGVGGPLLSGGTLTGAQSVSFNAADGGSGVSTGTITVDGAVAVERGLDASGGGCTNLGVSADGRPSYLNTQPCAPSVSGLLTLDTSTLSPGAHAIVVSVTDAAGNATVVTTSTIDVAGSVAAGTPNGAGASRAAKLTARWTSTRRPSRRLAQRPDRHRHDRLRRGVSHPAPERAVAHGDDPLRRLQRRSQAGGAREAAHARPRAAQRVGQPAVAARRRAADDQRPPEVPAPRRGRRHDPGARRARVAHDRDRQDAPRRALSLELPLPHAGLGGADVRLPRAGQQRHLSV